MDIPKFSDLAEKITLDGEKVKMEDILNVPIVVTGYRITQSKYKSNGSEYCTKIQFYREDDPDETKYVFFTGSEVIREQIEEMDSKLEENELPKIFRTTVKKVGNYNSLT